MLCSFCEGTENSPLPNTFLFDGPRPSSTRVEPDTCRDCGTSLWSACSSCIGLGKKLKIIGSCSRCGRSIPYWQVCATCKGTGKMYTSAHECKMRKKPLEKTITKTRAGQKQHSPAHHTRPPAA